MKVIKVIKVIKDFLPILILALSVIIYIAMIVFSFIYFGRKLKFEDGFCGLECNGIDYFFIGIVDVPASVFWPIAWIIYGIMYSVKML